MPRRAPGVAAPRPAQLGAASVWVEYFFGLQVLCQLLLIVPGIGPVRVAVRVAAFAVSLALLALLPGAREKHPSDVWAILIVAIVGLMWFHPTTNTPLSGLAQGVLYIAILAPMIWVSRVRVDVGAVERLLRWLWGFHALSSVFGILQVYFPGRFQPEVSAALSDATYVEALQITLDSGEQVYRPMGLTDAPGGAANAGFYVALLGSGMLVTAKTTAARAIYGVSMVLGMACIYLSQVRTALVVLAICMLAFGFALWLTGRAKRFVGAFAAIALVAVLGFAVSTNVAEEAVTKRFSTLYERDASEVYRGSRGHFLERTFDELVPKYPLGAGPGRWGMMNVYFGDNRDRLRAPLWVEIQWTGWLFDGGVPLMIAYAGAVVAALVGALRVALRHAKDELGTWGALVFAHGVGILALTFSYPVFVSQSGLEFWLLNAALIAAGATKVAAEAASAKAAPAKTQAPPSPPRGQPLGLSMPSAVSPSALSNARRTPTE